MDYQQEKGLDARKTPHVVLDNPESNLSRLLREYKDAKELFDEACRDAENVLLRRGNAAEILSKLTSEVINAVQNGLHDPTQAQGATAMPPPRHR